MRKNPWLALGVLFIALAGTLWLLDLDLDAPQAEHATPGTPTVENFMRLRPGMSESEVHSILGPPTAAKVCSDKWSLKEMEIEIQYDFGGAGAKWGELWKKTGEKLELRHTILSKLVHYFATDVIAYLMLVLWLGIVLVGGVTLVKTRFNQRRKEPG